MTPLVVSDTGPLIGLARISQLPILKRLYNSITIPPQVLKELHISTDKPGARALSKAIADGWINTAHPKKISTPGILTLILDAGEAAAIQLASEEDVRLLILDDRRGREIASRRGIKIIGTGGILVSAKRMGYLKKVTPVLNDLSRVGYRLSPELCKRIIELAGEV